MFPRLRDGYQFTSPETDEYNCIAWAVWDIARWWWPTPRYACYWPPGVPRDSELSSIIHLFENRAFQRCDDSVQEPGWEKVAIYVLPDQGVTHVARQLQAGSWTSKIGEWEDIRHDRLNMLEGEEYGVVAQVMKRRRPEWDK